MTKEESDAALAGKQFDSQIEVYYCVECKEEFGKNDTEWPEHEDHDGFRKITVFQGWVVDEIKAALESRPSVLEALEAAKHELIEAEGRIAAIEVKTRDPSNELSVERALGNIGKALALIKNAQGEKAVKAT